jgi:hypothetical protein
VRVWFLYAIGSAAVGFAFFEFWRDRIADQNAFLIGGLCIAAAAGMQVLGDIWRRLRR